MARDPADPSVITSIRLNEISLVDRPCNPDATIDLWKADPVADPPRDGPILSAQPSNDAVKAEAERMARAAGRPGRRNDYLTAARAALIKGAVPTDASPKPDASAAPDKPAPEAPSAPTSDGPDAPAPDTLDDSDDDADAAKIQAMHDQCVALGARCDHAAPSELTAQATDAAKASDSQALT
ncbi:hypothetical protein ACNJUT_21240, partial [Mycobacterium tuberculosis]